jgi:hypothetical protein
MKYLFSKSSRPSSSTVARVPQVEERWFIATNSNPNLVFKYKYYISVDKTPGSHTGYEWVLGSNNFMWYKTDICGSIWVWNLVSDIKGGT